MTRRTNPPMVTKVTARLAHLVAVLIGVSFLVFMLIQLLPGDPAQTIVAASSNADPNAVVEVRHSLGLDQPLATRYVSWLGNAATGDLGRSFRNQQPVFGAIADRLPVSLELMLLAEILSLAVAVPWAIYAARRRDSWFDKSSLTATFGAQALPNFVISLLLIYLFAVTLRWLPAVGFTPLGTDLVANLKSMAIPVVSLSAGLVPIYLRILRADVIKTLQEDFVLLARSQGLRPRTILFRYALRPSVSTLVTVAGISIGALIGGSIIVEQISSVPGLGTLLFSAITNRDYTLVQGVVVVIAVGYTLANFVVDLLYSVIDPRVRA